MIRGTVITLGERKYLLPPLNAEAMELHGEFIQKAIAKNLTDEDTVNGMSIVTELIHMALKRNYPDLDAAEVKRNMDFGNMQELMACLFKTSGFVETTGEPAPGNGPIGAG